MLREKPRRLVSGPLRSTSSSADQLQTKSREKNVAVWMREECQRLFFVLLWTVWCIDLKCFLFFDIAVALIILDCNKCLHYILKADAMIKSLNPNIIREQSARLYCILETFKARIFWKLIILIKTYRNRSTMLSHRQVFKSVLTGIKQHRVTQTQLFLMNVDISFSFVLPRFSFFT